MQRRGVTGVYVSNIHQDRPVVNPFSYSPDIIQALESALSAERLTASLRVTSGDRTRAAPVSLEYREQRRLLRPPPRRGSGPA